MKSAHAAWTGSPSRAAQAAGGSDRPGRHEAPLESEPRRARSIRTIRELALAAVAVLLVGASAFAQDRTTIVAGKVMMPDGKLAENTGVVIVGGKIESVGDASKLAATGPGTYLKLDGAVLCPGLIDLGSSLGAFGANAERLKPIDPQASVQDAIDPRDAALTRALQAGITSVMVTPVETSIVTGAAATVRTYSADGRLDVLRSDGPIMFALGPNVWNADREPTSRPGSLSLLRDALKQAKAGTGDSRLAQVIEKKLSAVVSCGAIEDVDGALRTFGEFGILPTIMHTSDAVQAAADLEGGGATAIVGPYSFTSTRRTLEGAAALIKAGVEVAFSAQTPSVEGAGLRATAALAVRSGMDADAARRGMTAVAAKIAGVSDRVGSIAAGKDADLVIFSGDPLRLDSRVLEVYIKGVRVYSAANTDAAGGSDEADE